MVSTIVSLTSANSRKLDEMARRSGKSTDALVNEAIERLPVQTSSREANWKAAWGEAAGMWSDYPELPALMDELRREINRVEPAEGEHA